MFPRPNPVWRQPRTTSTYRHGLAIIGDRMSHFVIGSDTSGEYFGHFHGGFECLMGGGSFALRSHDRIRPPVQFTGCSIVILVLGNAESHFMSVYELFSVRYGRVKWFCTHFCTRYSHRIQDFFFFKITWWVTHLPFRHIQQLNVTNIYVGDKRLTSLAGFWYHR